MNYKIKVFLFYWNFYIFMGVLKYVILYEEILFKCFNNDKFIVIEWKVGWLGLIVDEWLVISYCLVE